MPELPFGPQSRTGFEIELLAPVGQSREALAHRLATAIGGSVHVGLKYISEGLYTPNQPVCDLTLTWIVKDADGQWFATLMDDITIRDELDPKAETPDGYYRIVMDDVRLALWMQERACSDRLEPEHVTRPLLECFRAQLSAPGDGRAQHASHRVVADPWEHTLAVVALYPGQRERVCEVVTRPLTRDERFSAISSIVEAARDLDFTIPQEGALHLHLDRDPWRSAPRLAALILNFSAERKQWYERLQPNPRCRRLGPFSQAVVDAARSYQGDDFEEFSELLWQARPEKHCDISILDILRHNPVQPTVEIRCLPLRLDLEEVQTRVEWIEAKLTEAAKSADS